MLEELRNASHRLRVSLDHYVRICSNVQDVCLKGTTPQDIAVDYADQIDRELGLIESYDVKMQLAKMAIKVTRNYAFKHVPINRLPTEIILLSFALVGALLPLAPPHFGLASIFILQCEMPLDVHISAVPEGPIRYYHDRSMVDLCKLAAPRMESLELDLERFEPSELQNTTRPEIASLFSHCSPGLFTKIITYSDHFGFFGPEQANLGALAIRLNMERAQFEAALASVTALHLTGLYPPWTSRAYHGLVELRLIASPGGGDSIAEWQLIKILNSSPRLRILQTSLDITNRVDGIQNVSASLPDLEVLQVDSEVLRPHNLCYLELVRFIRPGLRPLKFTMECSGLQLTEFSKAQTKAFLARSNVTQFHAISTSSVFDLLSSMPHLKALILSSCEPLPMSEPSASEPSDQQSPSPVLHAKLEVCVVLECSLSLDEFQLTVQQCQVQSLMIYCSKFHTGIKREEVDMVTVMKVLSEVCPDVKITDTIPRFVEHRDFCFDTTSR
ncbi:hypothetical protein OPQ81_003476 [Rhizoctonia solani]|nr:hypothetical protein OPQ81_003476 [Rhizoctonia solani]